jgi:hypothetical protein
LSGEDAGKSEGLHGRTEQRVPSRGVGRRTAASGLRAAVGSRLIAASAQIVSGGTGCSCPQPSRDARGRGWGGWVAAVGMHDRLDLWRQGRPPAGGSSWEHKTHEGLTGSPTLSGRWEDLAARRCMGVLPGRAVAERCGCQVGELHSACSCGLQSPAWPRPLSTSRPGLRCCCRGGQDFREPGGPGHSLQPRPSSRPLRGRTGGGDSK